MHSSQFMKTHISQYLKVNFLIWDKKNDCKLLLFYFLSFGSEVTQTVPNNLFKYTTLSQSKK